MRTLVFVLTLIFTLSISSCATRVVTRSANVVVVKSLPQHYKVVRVKGKRYYLWNGKHYRKTRRGYVVVRI